MLGREKLKKKKKIHLCWCVWMDGVFINIQGKGFEHVTDEAYQNCRIMFMGIANIHAVRKSYENLREFFF